MASNRPREHGFNGLLNFFLHYGFTNSRCDSSLFIYHHGSHIAYLLLYVDDILLTASSLELLHKITKVLGSKFSTTDLGDLNNFLGISIKQESHGMFLSRCKYALEILTRSNTLNYKPACTHADMLAKLHDFG